MQLFSTDRSLQLSRNASLGTKTPFCTIKASLQINAKKLSEIPLVSALTTNDEKTYVFSWEVDGCIIECLKSELPFSMDFNIDHINLWVYIWRIHNGPLRAHTELSCGVKFDTPSPEGFINTGENLIAKTWETNGSTLSIGTEDHDALFSRSESAWMPPRFFKNGWPSPQSLLEIHTLTNDIAIAPPLLLPEERLQLQFLCAWATGEDAETATWQAIDRSPCMILDQILFR